MIVSHNHYFSDSFIQIRRSVAIVYEYIQLLPHKLKQNVVTKIKPFWNTFRQIE